MNELTPMKLNEDFLESPERFKVYEAEYNDFLFSFLGKKLYPPKKLRCRIIKTVMNYQN